MARLNAWVHQSDFGITAFQPSHQSPHPADCLDRSDSDSVQALRSPYLFLLTPIPPERVGIHGEYDHQGLAKRVSLAIQEQMEASVLSGLRIAQRGRVVILSGQVLNYKVLCRIVGIAQSIEGTAFVETDGMHFLDSLTA
jgi:hypothetical protein